MMAGPPGIFIEYSLRLLQKQTYGQWDPQFGFFTPRWSSEIVKVEFL